MKYSEMLKGIRHEFLPDGKGVFVFVALEKKYGYYSTVSLSDYFQEILLAGERTIDDWLIENHLEFSFNTFEGNEKSYRLVWIDEMIEDFDKEGN